MERVAKSANASETFLVVTDPKLSIEKLSEYFEQDRATAALLYRTGDAIVTEHDIVKFVASGQDASTAPIESIMTINPVCVSAVAKPVEILERMKKARFRHVPQVDERGKVVDIVDIVTVARQLHEEQKNDNRSSSFLKSIMDRLFAPEVSSTISAVNTWGEINFTEAETKSTSDPAVLGISKDTTIEDAAKEMLKRKTSGLLVVDMETGELEGIFCESDIVRKVVSRGLPPSQIKVRAAMTIKPTTLNMATTKPLDALNMMLEKRFRHLPVADENNRAAGLHSILNLTFEVLGTRLIGNTANNINRAGDDEVIARGLHTYLKLVQMWENKFSNDEIESVDVEESQIPACAKGDKVPGDKSTYENQSTPNQNSSASSSEESQNNKFLYFMEKAFRKRNEALKCLSESQCQKAKKLFGTCMLRFNQAEKYIMDSAKNRRMMEQAKADVHFRLGETNFVIGEYSDALHDYQQVELLVCSNGRSFENNSAIEWMKNCVGVHPSKLMASKMEALCQLLRYEDAVECLSVIKPHKELLSFLVDNVLLGAVNQHIEDAMASLENKRFDDAKIEFGNAKRFLSTFDRVKVSIKASLTLDQVEFKLNEISNIENRGVEKKPSTKNIKKELSELAFLMQSMNQNNIPASTIANKGTIMSPKPLDANDENSHGTAVV